MSAIIEQARAERAQARPPRLPIIDAARGAALVAMFAYHLTWDLGYFRLIDPAIPLDPRFKFFGHCIAASFLALVGASLVLAARPELRWRPYLTRLAQIGAAAAAVTLATWYAFPDSFIFFGILHCIIAASLAALLFLRAPIWLTLLAAAAIFSATYFFVSAYFDQPMFWWTGLGHDEPLSNDWRPVFPWVGFALIGVVAMRAGLDYSLPAWFTNWRGADSPSRGLRTLGRHSLLVYLVHQPVFLALLFVGLHVVGRSGDPDEAPFVSACETKCIAAGTDATICAKFCGCIVQETRTAALWRKVLTQSLNAGEQERLDGLTRQCARSAAGLTP
jgi:uncharacterized membrane protein